MNFLPLINEIAVAGTAFLMMSISILWHSTTLFSHAGWSEEEMEEAESHALIILSVRFFLFLVVIAILAYMLALSIRFSLDPIFLAALFAVAASAMTALPMLFERRPMSYIAINVSFVALFIIGSTLVLQYWPW